MRMKPYTATLVITPLISAETWLGAAGCASGSHTCSGTRPAFEPAPSRTRIKTNPESAVVAPRIWSNAYPPLPPASTPKASSSASVPKLAMTM